MEFKEILARARPKYYFGLIFWTPFWLLPVLSERGVTSKEILENIFASIAVSALLESFANLIGPRRRYFYLAVGVILWIGAAAFIAYAVVARGMINSLALFDAAQYATPGYVRQFSYVYDLGDIPPWIIALCAPFVALRFYWRQLDYPPTPVYAGVLAIIFLLPLPLKVANCVIAHSCSMHKFSIAKTYPVEHYAPTASYIAAASMLELRAVLGRPSERAHPAVEARDGQRPFTLVVIVDESINRNHMSLYGYCRLTTPNLDTRARSFRVSRRCKYDADDHLRRSTCAHHWAIWGSRCGEACVAARRS
jgi:glucan phosphoethanolaminetransferase (alkaline phosphatase superfamily)